MCILISSTTFRWKHSPWQILTKLEFYDGLSKKKIHKDQISWKSVQWQSSCSMRTDRWTDMTKQTVAFRNFANARKKRQKCHLRPSVKSGCLWTPVFTKLVIAQGHHVEVFYTDFHENPSKNVEITSRNSFTP